MRGQGIVVHFQLWKVVSFLFPPKENWGRRRKGQGAQLRTVDVWRLGSDKIYVGLNGAEERPGF